MQLSMRICLLSSSVIQALSSAVLSAGLELSTEVSFGTFVLHTTLKLMTSRSAQQISKSGKWFCMLISMHPVLVHVTMLL